MIVNYTGEGWEVITQRTHGLLAAKLALYWRHDVRTDRWTETLLAIAEHDDAQIEIDGDDLLTKAGGPLNFKMKVYDEGHCRRTFTASLSKSRYIALLASMHLDFVYKDACAEDNAARAFLKEQAIWRKKWLKELKMTPARAQKDYRLLEWCDALSLLLCQHENQPEERSVEISKGPDDRLYQLTQPEDGVLTVDPWPFETDQFDVSFEYRIITQLQFKDTSEFRSAFMSAEVFTKVWAFRKTS